MADYGSVCTLCVHLVMCKPPPVNGRIELAEGKSLRPLSLLAEGRFLHGIVLLVAAAAVLHSTTY